MGTLTFSTDRMMNISAVKEHLHTIYALALQKNPFTNIRLDKIVNDQFRYQAARKYE